MGDVVKLVMNIASTGYRWLKWRQDAAEGFITAAEAFAKQNYTALRRMPLDSLIDMLTDLDGLVSFCGENEELKASLVQFATVLRPIIGKAYESVKGTQWEEPLKLSFVRAFQIATETLPQVKAAASGSASARPKLN